jgi:DNA-binding CsgD family transcriptional regulator
VNWGWNSYSALINKGGSLTITYAPNATMPVGNGVAGALEAHEITTPASARVDNSWMEGPAHTGAPVERGGLSSRQQDVLKLIVLGRSNKEIARALDLAEGTIKIHVAALFAKLGVRRRSALALAGARFLTRPAQADDQTASA